MYHGNARVRGTYRDEGSVYLLMDACLGGEMFTMLRRMRSPYVFWTAVSDLPSQTRFAKLWGSFDEPTARFYAQSVSTVKN